MDDFSFNLLSPKSDQHQFSLWKVRTQDQSHFISSLSMTDRVNVLLHRTVFVDSDLRPGAPLTYFNDGGGRGGVRRIFLGLTFWPKRIFMGLWKTPGFFWVAKTTEGFFLVLYFSSAQIKNNISAIYSFVFDQNQSWSWHVLAFQKINNKICWCKNTEGFFWVC